MYTIRPAVPEDAGRISLFIVELAKEFIVNEFRVEGQRYFLGELTPEKMQERLLGEFRFFLAEKKKNLVGVAAVRGSTLLYYLFVGKTFQRQGIAKQLWLIAKEACLHSNSSGFFTVNASTYSVPVYERLGFIRRGPPQEMRGVVYHPMEFK
jgi:GNAT superfamily N-acetyltransferase